MMTAIEQSIWHRTLASLGSVAIRPLSLAHWDAYLTFVHGIAREDLHRRFAGGVNLDLSSCRRLFDIDHDREEAFAAFDSHCVILGVARIVRLTATEAEIALVVRSDLKRRGIGSFLLERLIWHGKVLGLDALIGDVLTDNLPMLTLARHAGFRLVGGAGPITAVRRKIGAPGASRAAVRDWLEWAG